MSKKQVQKQPKFTQETLNYYFKAKDIAVKSSTEDFSEKLFPLAKAFYVAKDEETRAPYREAIIQEVYGRIERYQALVQQIQDNINEQLGYPPPAYNSFEIEKVETVVRRTAQKLFETANYGNFIKLLKSYTETKVINGRSKN